MKPYNKEEVMKSWEEEFTYPNICGEKQLAQICTNNYTLKTPIFKAESDMVTKHKSFLSTALDAAYKAGEEKVKNKIKECVNTCSDDISYLDSNSNNECIRIFKVNLEALK